MARGVARVEAARLRRARDLPQLVHGDLTDNVLFHDELSPGIDFVPYWHPTEYAIAIIATDAVLSGRARRRSLLDAAQPQYLLRARAGLSRSSRTTHGRRSPDLLRARASSGSGRSSRPQHSASPPCWQMRLRRSTTSREVGSSSASAPAGWSSSTAPTAFRSRRRRHACGCSRSSSRSCTASGHRRLPRHALHARERACAAEASPAAASASARRLCATAIRTCTAR
jgi:hypothetical protein